jgi:hypothetical protein
MPNFSKPNNRQWLRLATWLVLGSAAAILVLILSGLFDPQPIGAQVWNVQPRAIHIEADTLKINWLDESPPLPAAYTLRLTAAHMNGELDSGYGLAIGSQESPFIVAVSPLGYVTVEHNRAAVLPWQTWPHVKTDTQPNEIWLDVQPLETASEITVRLNRELLWSGEVAISGPDVGLVVESFGEGMTADFQHLELFVP